jgi:hypothetical protein
MLALPKAIAARAGNSAALASRPTVVVSGVGTAAWIGAGTAVRKRITAARPGVFDMVW